MELLYKQIFHLGTTERYENYFLPKLIALHLLNNDLRARFSVTDIALKWIIYESIA